MLYVDDLADAIVFFLNKKTKESLINIGSGFEKSINDYALIIGKILNWKIKIQYIKNNLNGTSRKLLNSNIAKKYGWKPKNSFKKSIEKTYISFIKKKIR